MTAIEGSAVAERQSAIEKCAGHGRGVGCRLEDPPGHGSTPPLPEPTVASTTKASTPASGGAASQDTGSRQNEFVNSDTIWLQNYG
ncbi:MAG: hypothetical protein C4345_13220 [Chloroflexota bacterium]